VQPTAPSGAPPLWTRNILLALAANFCLFCGMQMLTPTLPLYIVGLGGTEPDVGVAVGAFVSTAIVVRLLAGSAGDRWGVKRVLFGSGALFAACGMLYPFVPGVGALIALRALHGVGWGLASPVASTVVAEEAPASRRGQAVGFIGLSTNVSSALAPLVALSLVDGFGYAVMFVVAALIAMLAPGLGAMLRTAPARMPRERAPARQLLPRYAMLPALVLGLGTMTWGAVAAFIPLRIVEGNLGSPALFFSTVAVVGIVTRPVVGTLSDRLGRNTVLLPALTLMAVGVTALTLAPSGPVLAAASAAFGLGWSAASTTMMVIFIDRSPPGTRSGATAAYFFGFEIGLAIGPSLAGPLASWLGIADMLRLFAVLPLAAVLVALVTGLARAAPRRSRSPAA
jgi:MFS family permease